MFITRTLAPRDRTMTGAAAARLVAVTALVGVAFAVLAVDVLPNAVSAEVGDVAREDILAPRPCRSYRLPRPRRHKPARKRPWNRSTPRSGPRPRSGPGSWPPTTPKWRPSRQSSPIAMPARSRRLRPRRA